MCGSVRPLVYSAAFQRSTLKAWRKSSRRARVCSRAAQTCLKAVRTSPDRIVPVTLRSQIVPGNSYVILVGWYKQQCVIVTPEMTVADLKAYLHHKNGTRMPMESIDIAFRDGNDLNVLDDTHTLNQVWIDNAKEEPAPPREPGPGTVAEVAAAARRRQRRRRHDFRPPRAG